MNTDLHTLSGAYALDALSPEEAADFHKHLAGCRACMDEVRELREAASLMGANEATPAPADLKARIMAAADQLAQLPPVTTPTPIGGARRADRPRRWTPRLLSAAAAAVLIVAGTFAVTQLQDDEPTYAAPVAQVFSAPDARKATVDTSNGGKITIATSQELGKMAVDTEDLAKLDERQVYQLWAITNGAPSSVGVLADVEDGAAMDMPAEGTEVAITIEPAGGSERPTTQPIVQVDPRAA